MKSIFLSIAFALSLFTGINDNVADEKHKEDAMYESCVSVATRIAGGDRQRFRDAYTGCIEGRMNED